MEWVEKRVLLLGEDLPEGVAAARRNLGHCDALTTDALEYAAQVLALKPESAEACRALRIGAEAMVALFDGALATGDTIEVRVGDGPAVVVPSGVDRSLHDVGNWTYGFYMAAICRESELLDSLCRVPTELLRRSSTRGLEHTYLMVEALQGYYRKEAEARGRAMAALQATNIKEQTAVTRELAAPTIEVLLCLMDGPPQAFNEALVRALDHHRGYWSREDVMRDPRGYFSLRLTGLAALAYDAGVPITVQSDYLPISLVRGDCRPAV